MNPQQRTLGAPLREDAAFKEPDASSRLVGLTCYVVVFGRIWGGDPISGVLLQLVTYQTDSAEVMKRCRTSNDGRFILFISLAIPCIVTGTSDQPAHNVHDQIRESVTYPECS